MVKNPGASNLRELLTPASAKEQAEEAIPGLQKVVAVTLAYTRNSGKGNTALLYLMNSLKYAYKLNV